MGLRETLNKNPAIATGVAVAVIVIAVGFIVYSNVGDSGPKSPSDAYYTIDDGATWFSGDAKKIAPFDHEGKQAVKVYLFKCGNGEPFAGYLERYTPDAKKKLEEQRNLAASQDGPPRSTGELQSLAMAVQAGREVKKPKDAKWTRMMDFRNSNAITQVKCPGEGNQPAEPVSP